MLPYSFVACPCVNPALSINDLSVHIGIFQSLKDGLNLNHFKEIGHPVLEDSELYPHTTYSVLSTHGSSVTK